MDEVFRYPLRRTMPYYVSVPLSLTMWLWPSIILYLSSEPGAASLADVFIPADWSGAAGLAFLLVFSVGIAAVRLISLCQYQGIILHDDAVEMPFFIWKWRRIAWSDVTRVQFIGDSDYQAQNIFRLRLFSNTQVISFMTGIQGFDRLMAVVREKVSQRNIPIYQESLPSIVFRRGSWSIDAQGRSAGIPVTRVSEIPEPKSAITR